jgi:DNA-directed RNA polymerase
MMAFRFGQAVRLSSLEVSPYRAHASREERFYFPCQVDHRGRVYPVPPLMNPQSDHIGRALIEFADGKPLGKRGAHYLGIHIANCYWKGKKVPFKNRLAWVRENEEEILDFAANPFLEAARSRACASPRLHRFWTEADQPWMFLAACLEWKRYKEEGPGMISHLPISMDGSCNGYQHLSAMGLDPIGGRATNLTASDEPADIYQWVSDLVCRRMEREARARQGEASSNAAAGNGVAQEFVGTDPLPAFTDASPYRASLRGRLSRCIRGRVALLSPS